MRVIVTVVALGSILSLAACSPPVPDSAAGVGIDGDPFAPPPVAGTTITGDPLVPPARISSEALPLANEPLPTAQRSAASSSIAASYGSGSAAAAGSGAAAADIAAETRAALQAAGSNSGQAPVEASPSNPAPALIGNPGISDENNFDAVAARQTIESDAQRLANQRSQYQQVAPTALPSQTGSRDPNIVQYALSTSHPVGTKIHSRAGINLRSRSARNCAGFRSPDQAQIAFLQAGGPKRDRQALDPDGDGYACGWDPSPFRLAVRGKS
ncbi:hypothetical protein [Pseudophaeobacter arcticus]|uniref:hypothetical protein n=1 Tax=Pseudophaeobacter arcticus TaxID=385492 RepID=UPI0024917FAD|nr:hypothetical protein [Pseudophaeobacter arcticus]